MSEDSRPSTTRSLWAWLIFAQICLLITVILCGVWFGQFKGGYDWDANNFNYHPFFCTLGFIYVYGQGTLQIGTEQYVTQSIVETNCVQPSGNFPYRDG